MSDTEVPFSLEAQFANDLPGLALPWRAEPAPDPHVVALNAPLARELGLDPAWLRTPAGLGLLTGNLLPTGATPVAQAYAGHQFGGFVPRLGDGRALLLGEVVDAKGQLRDLHLKGSGRTPFARGGDGLAALGPMLREYVISEAMHALGVPTTRSLAVVSTGRGVQREEVLPGAVLARVASSHLRVGSFQYAAASGDINMLRSLADHAIDRHYPRAAEAERPYLALLEAVVDAQASLLARWMLVGFVHGVMNTDNMTISGEAIDYGPCAFLDAYDPTTVFSSIDRGGRYAFGNQPAVAQWNLARLAETLLPVIDPEPDRAIELASASVAAFRPRYDDAWGAGILAKVGLDGRGDKVVATSLITDWISLLGGARADHSTAYRALGAAARGDSEPVRGLFLDLQGLDEWLARWAAQRPDAALMDRTNPLYIPRNHLVEEALTAATDGDLTPFNALLEVVTEPFSERPGLERYAEAAPDEFGAYRTFCGT